MSSMLMSSPKHSPGLRNAGHESLQLNVNDLKFTTLQRRGRAPWKQFGDPPLPRGKYAVLYITLMGQFTKLVKPGLHTPCVALSRGGSGRCNSLRCGVDPPPDLNWAERLLNESLARSPNSLSAHYSLALLQKYRRQYQASMQSLQRCLELNPSFLPAQGQIGNILTRIGEPQKGLEQIQQTMRAAIPNDPTIGILVSVR